MLFPNFALTLFEIVTMNQTDNPKNSVEKKKKIEGLFTV